MAKSTIHSLQWRFQEHGIIISNTEFCDSSLINAAVTNWCCNFALKKDEKEHLPTPVNNRIMAVVDPEEVEMLMSSPNQAQGNIIVQNEAKFRVLEKKVDMTQLCEKGFIPISCHCRKSLPSSTRWSRRMGTNHTFMQRKNLFSSLPTSQTLGSYSSRHNCRTDPRGSYCENSLLKWSGSSDSIN